MFQDKKKYMDWLKRDLVSHFVGRKGVRLFLFGRSIRDDRFADVDVGIDGDVSDEDVATIKGKFEESTFPFFVDVVNFKTVGRRFKENVLGQGVLWIKR